MENPEDKLPELDDTALDWLKSAREITPISGREMHSTWERIESSIDVPKPFPSSDALKHSANAGGTVALSKAALALLVAAGVGFGALIDHEFASPKISPPRVEERIVYRDRIVDHEVRVEVPAAQNIANVEPHDAVHVEAHATPRATNTATHEAPTVAQTQLGEDAARAAERALISRGQMALARGNYSGTLDAINEHNTQFPHGWLLEESDALRVQALAGLDRRTEARARAAEFITTYPRSLFRPLIEDILDHAESAH